jgi:hypothetical protein
MTQTKYFVIRYNGENPELHMATNFLNDARDEAQRAALSCPQTRFLIATETQSVVVQTQVNWTDK